MTKIGAAGSSAEAVLACSVAPNGSGVLASSRLRRYSPRSTTSRSPSAGVAGGAVVTGDGHEVDGRDPETGSVLWSYARDLTNMRVFVDGVTELLQYERRRSNREMCG